MLDKNARRTITGTARAFGLGPEQIAAGLAAMDGTVPKAEISALAVHQARVCEMLSCSRHHVRKLERLGLLKPVELAGVKRYPVDAIRRLLITPEASDHD